MAPSGFTSSQVYDMVTHLRACSVCGLDEELLAELEDESLPAEELADAIATAHDPRWLALLETARRADDSRGGRREARERGSL
ncbi:hypothetical protein [Nonomuraea sp. LPB2021202275-12-8]|uniref:hypothetical protein n=1 Tax=Nonomuraea sp. LPB2021202275-12-8 TaxID=3120159 RepID=UPI00300C9935